VYQHSTVEHNESRVILTDTTSSVPGFESMGRDWLEQKRAEGAALCAAATLVL
jgi:hypothetical protein